MCAAYDDGYADGLRPTGHLPLGRAFDTFLPPGVVARDETSDWQGGE